MARLSLRVWHLLLLGLLFTPLLQCSGPSLAMAQEEEEEEDDVEVEVEEDDIPDGDEEEPVSVPDRGEEVTLKEEGELEEEEEEDQLGPSINASTLVVFTNFPDNEFIAGQMVKSIIGFTNNGETNFIITSIEASFRYPQDFNYHIQNFSHVQYETFIPPNTEVSFVYDFRPSETFYARSYGFVLNIYYHDESGPEYRSAVFNNTISIVEVEETFDAETFFMYLFMVSGLCLLMFIVHYVYTTVWKGGRSLSFGYKKSKPVETGTQKKDDDVDYQWVPNESIPNKSPRASPRNRRGGKK